MKIIKTLFIAVLALGLSSCGQKDSKGDVEEFNTLLAEVFEVHDDMMPQMGKISEMRQELEVLAQEQPMDSVAYNEAIQDLIAAHKGMMDWMKDFGVVFPYKEDRLEGMTEAQIKESIELMKEQKVSVDAMKLKMQESMEKAQVLLEK